MKFDNEWAPFVDIVAKQKLFSFIVDDLDDAKKLLDANQAIKGQVITIHPLTMLNEIEMKKKPATPQGCTILSDVVNISENAD